MASIIGSRLEYGHKIAGNCISEEVDYEKVGLQCMWDVLYKVSHKG